MPEIKFHFENNFWIKFTKIWAYFPNEMSVNQKNPVDGSGACKWTVNYEFFLQSFCRHQCNKSAQNPRAILATVNRIVWASHPSIEKEICDIFLCLTDNFCCNYKINRFVWINLRNITDTHDKIPYLNWKRITSVSFFFFSFWHRNRTTKIASE